MAKKPAAIAPDERVPVGYGRLVSVTPLGAKEVVLWFEDSSATVRAVRMTCDLADGLALAMSGQAQIVRT